MPHVKMLAESTRAALGFNGFVFQALDEFDAEAEAKKIAYAR